MDCSDYHIKEHWKYWVDSLAECCLGINISDVLIESNIQEYVFISDAYFYWKLKQHRLQIQTHLDILFPISNFC